MADGSKLLTAPSPLLGARRVTGSVYVIDLIGFSRMTETRIAQSARVGAETVTRLITNLFGELMAELASLDIQFGGFAGDALIAWQPDTDDALSASTLQALTESICDRVAAGLSCRTATADGSFWTADATLNQRTRPILWGPAVRQAFITLESEPGRARPSADILDTDQISDPQILVTASVTDRWIIVMRALTPDACAATEPDQLAALVQRAGDVCAAVGAEIDNIVQDDKGLLIVAVLPVSRSQDTAQRDQLLAGLTAILNPIAQGHEAKSEFGTIFRCRLELAGTPIMITIGKPINQAAKSLTPSADAQMESLALTRSHETVRDLRLIGREEEVERLWSAYQASGHSRQTLTLTAAAGMGKSALVQTLVSRIGGTVRVIEASPGSRFLPFGCAQDLAESCSLPPNVVFQSDAQVELARQLPPVVVIENWQWCDADSKRLIRRLHDNRDNGLLLITSRTPVDNVDANSHLSVEPLSFMQSQSLMETLAPSLMDAHMQRSIFELTAGTPFWLRQAALHFAEREFGSSALRATAGLDGLLAARGRNLSEPATALWRLYCAWRHPLDFQTASEFLAKFDIEISPDHRDEIDQLGWLVRDDPNDRSVYRPAHDILADWGSSDLPPTFERALHSTIARAVTKQNGTPSRIARHWQIAGQDLRAAIWFDRAAKHADRAGAHMLTIAHLKAAEHLVQTAQTIDETKHLNHLALSATAHWGVGKLRRARHILSEFDARAKTIPSSPAKRAALRRAATIQSETGQFAGNSRLILAGMVRGWQNSRGDEGHYEVKARRQGFIYYALGLMRLPVSGRLNRLTERAHQSGEFRSQALLGCSAATLHMIRCDWDQADSILTDCHAAVAQTDDQQMLGVAQTLIGLCHLFQGQADTAFRWFERVTETGRDQGHHMFNVWGAYAKAEARLYAEDVEHARHFALEARGLSKGLGDHQSACIIEGLLAQIYLADASYALARQHARNAARFAAKLPPTNFSTLEGIAAPAQVGAELLRISGNPDPDLETMIKTGRRALNSYAQVFKVAQPRHHYVEGVHARSRGDLKAAQRHFRKAQSASETLGMRYEEKLAVSALQTLKEARNGAPTEIH